MVVCFCFFYVWLGSLHVVDHVFCLSAVPFVGAEVVEAFVVPFV